MTIALDAMGGDHAPDAAVRGAVECARDRRCDFDIVLVGDASAVRRCLGADVPARITVVHAPQTIAMDESPTTALKTKPDSSIVRGLELQRDGAADAFASAGNTGAVMAASTVVLGRLPGVARPTIGTFLPNPSGWTLLVDAGANVDSRPQHLAQFGIMGSIFTEQMRGIARPRVGLLNVGEEEGKGGETAVEAHALLRGAPIHFIGNIEGRDVLTGAADVAVCDGFLGNILLKFAESFPGLLRAKFRDYASGGPIRKLWMGAIAPTIRGIFREWDYQEHGGVPLLGIRGVSIIGHGNSTPRAFSNMLFRAQEMIARAVTSRIADAMRPAAP